MAFGTFDIVHEGHKHYLQQAKKLGDFLIVVVSRDKNTLILKGKKPRHNEKARLEEIKKLDFVNEAVLGDREMRSWGIIAKHRPQILALGYDQWKSEISLAKELEKLGLHPMIVRIKPFKPKQFKTSKILGQKEPGQSA
jgi:FAD synthetase